jgi:tetratricopeptide (TPR) repeat protein
MKAFRIAGLMSCLIILPLLRPVALRFSPVSQFDLFSPIRHLEEFSDSVDGREELPPGKIIEKVNITADPSQSFALYIPSNYKSSRKWPIIYGFDPGSRGLSPIEHFKDAAEKYGFIVVGSNNSRNGSNVPLRNIIANLWEQTHSMFPIDDQRVYTTGFSGGARVAVGVAYMFAGQVNGVIACGAGFPQNATPAKSTPFVFYGMAGNEDFNFIELKRLTRAMDTVQMQNRMAVFEGGHMWPPAANCTEAVEWMQIQAMKTGKLGRDDSLIDAVFNRDLAKAKAAESANHPYDAYLAYVGLSRDFSGLKDTNEFEKITGQLKSSKDVIAGFKLEEHDEQSQDRTTALFMTLRNEMMPGSDDYTTQRAKVVDLVRSLRRKADNKENSNEQLVAKRTLLGLSILLYEESSELMLSKNYSRAAENYSIATEIQPDNPRPFLGMARAYALSKEKKKAIEALKKAVEKGFSDAGQLEKITDFDLIREDAEFKNLLTTLRGKQH